mmetsp:Transcript_11105/g.27237  ORF Transcript_11105/g.27237 Transcript_11105/m.27237 type:complete len:293 (+) Transcript_11105:490-1368(+)
MCVHQPLCQDLSPEEMAPRLLRGLVAEVRLVQPLCDDGRRLVRRHLALLWPARKLYLDVCLVEDGTPTRPHQAQCGSCGLNEPPLVALLVSLHLDLDDVGKRGENARVYPLPACVVHPRDGLGAVHDPRRPPGSPSGEEEGEVCFADLAPVPRSTLCCRPLRAPPIDCCKLDRPGGGSAPALRLASCLLRVALVRRGVLRALPWVSQESALRESGSTQGYDHSRKSPPTPKCPAAPHKEADTGAKGDEREANKSLAQGAAATIPALALPATPVPSHSASLLPALHPERFFTC